MHVDRFYLREGVKGFPLQKQQEMQAAASFADKPTYLDKLKRRGPNRRRPESIERERMLKPTRQGTDEIIAVAGIRCLADGLLDLATVIAACEACKASIYCLDTGKLYNPATMKPSESAALSADFDGAAKRQQTEEGRKTAHKARSKHAKAERDPILEKARPIWELPTDKITSAQVAERVGKSASFLNNHLGPRWKAREAAESRKRPISTKT